MYRVCWMMFFMVWRDWVSLYPLPPYMPAAITGMSEWVYPSWMRDNLKVSRVMNSPWNPEEVSNMRPLGHTSESLFLWYHLEEKCLLRKKSMTSLPGGGGSSNRISQAKGMGIWKKREVLWVFGEGGSPCQSLLLGWSSRTKGSPSFTLWQWGQKMRVGWNPRVYASLHPQW